MQRRWIIDTWAILVLVMSVFGGTASAQERDVVSYVPSMGGARFSDVLPLSDGTFIVAGRVADLDWVPPGVPVTELVLGEVDAASDAGLGVLIHMSADFDAALAVAQTRVVPEIRRVRAVQPAGGPTGVLTISGMRPGAAGESGYFIARLEGDPLIALPTRAAWSIDVDAPARRAAGFQGTSAFAELQPWDVTSQGEVIYGRGAEFDYDWASVEKVGADGEPVPVEHWPMHTTDETEHHGPASQALGVVRRSSIALKGGRIGSLRSRTQEDFDALVPDGNGGQRRGRYPDDLFVSGPCIDRNQCPEGESPEGFRLRDLVTARLGAIVVDQRTDDVYIGYTYAVRRPQGGSGFEPTVAALSADGTLRWATHLHPEPRTGMRVPAQYVDDLAMDHATGSLVVLGRANGNEAHSFFDGRDYANNLSAPDGFQPNWTGSNGGIHVSWLGKLRVSDGALMHATYVAELNEGLQGSNGTFGASVPLLEGYPNPRAGWPDLNSTRCQGLDVGEDGRVAVACTGRRTLTTLNAHQRMPRPGEGSGVWNAFARIYSPELHRITYSTLLTGSWTWSAPESTTLNTMLGAVGLRGERLVAVGWHLADSEGFSLRDPVPTVHVPTYGSALPFGGEQAFFGCIGCLVPEPTQCRFEVEGDTQRLEEGQAGVWSVVRDDATGPMRVTFEVEGDAELGQDVSFEPPVVDFARGVERVDVVIRALEDELEEPAESMTVTLAPTRHCQVGQGSRRIIVEDARRIDEMDMGAPPVDMGAALDMSDVDDSGNSAPETPRARLESSCACGVPGGAPVRTLWWLCVGVMVGARRRRLARAPGRGTGRR